MSSADIVVKVHGQDATDLGQKIAAIDALARTPKAVTGLPVDLPGSGSPWEPPVDPSVGLPEVAPYFDIGDGTGKVGDVVELSVEAGCRFLTNGFHIGGGVGRTSHTGYGLFNASSVQLGDFLTAYFKSVGLIVNTKDEALPPNWVDQYWSIFQFVNAGNRALPEEWWEFSVGFFSMQQKATVPPIQIPSGTELFRLKIQILEGTEPGEYELTCKDEHYYTNSRPRRRDFMFTAGRDSEFARGGITKLDLMGGKIMVIRLDQDRLIDRQVTA